MTTAPSGPVLPPLPVVAHLVTNEHGSTWVQKHPGTANATEEPLVKLSDALAAIACQGSAVREECAKMCDEEAATNARMFPDDPLYHEGALECASAIRAKDAKP